MRSFVGVMALSVLLAGCASLFSEDEQAVHIDGNVKGAEIYIGDNMIGKIPFMGKVSREDTKKAGGVMVMAKGYENQFKLLDTGVKAINKFFWFNLLSGGTFGMTTDWSTGAMWEVSPNKFYFEMIKSEASKNEMDKHRRSVQLKDFIFKHYGKIQRELVTGAEGGYSASLMSMTFIEREKLVEMAKQTSDPVEFAERVLKNIRI